MAFCDAFVKPSNGSIVLANCLLVIGFAVMQNDLLLYDLIFWLCVADFMHVSFANYLFHKLRTFMEIV